MQAKFLFYLFAAAILTALHPAIAQQPPKMPQIGFVTVSGDPNKPGLLVEAFRQRAAMTLVTLRERTSESNIATPKESRTGFQASWPNSCNSRSMSWSAQVRAALRAAKQATKTIPIVMVATFDPVEMGWSIAWRARAGISPG